MRHGGEPASLELSDAEVHQPRQDAVLDDRVDGHAGVARVVDEVIELELAPLVHTVGKDDQRVTSGLLLQLVQHLDGGVVEVRLALRLDAVD